MKRQEDSKPIKPTLTAEWIAAMEKDPLAISFDERLGCSNDGCVLANEDDCWKGIKDTSIEKYCFDVDQLSEEERNQLLDDFDHVVDKIEATGVSIRPNLKEGTE